MSHYRMFTKNQIKEIANEVATLLTENKEDKVNINQDVIEIKFTQDDYNEETNQYEKRVELIDGQIYSVTIDDNIDIKQCFLFSKNLLSISKHDQAYYNGFNGTTGDIPENHYVSFNEPDMSFVIIQGHLMICLFEL